MTLSKFMDRFSKFADTGFKKFKIEASKEPLGRKCVPSLAVATRMSNNDTLVVETIGDNIRLPKQIERIFKHFPTFVSYVDGVVDLLKSNPNDVSAQCHMYNVCYMLNIYIDLSYTCITKPAYEVVRDCGYSLKVDLKQNSKRCEAVFIREMIRHHINNSVSNKYLSVMDDFLNKSVSDLLGITFEPEDLRLTQYNCVKLNKTGLL